MHCRLRQIWWREGSDPLHHWKTVMTSPCRGCPLKHAWDSMPRRNPQHASMQHLVLASHDEWLILEQRFLLRPLRPLPPCRASYFNFPLLIHYHSAQSHSSWINCLQQAHFIIIDRMTCFRTPLYSCFSFCFAFNAWNMPSRFMSLMVSWPCMRHCKHRVLYLIAGCGLGHPYAQQSTTGRKAPGRPPTSSLFY